MILEQAYYKAQKLYCVQQKIIVEKLRREKDENAVKDKSPIILHLMETRNEWDVTLSILKGEFWQVFRTPVKWFQG